MCPGMIFQIYKNLDKLVIHFVACIIKHGFIGEPDISHHWYMMYPALETQFIAWFHDL